MIMGRNKNADTKDPAAPDEEPTPITAGKVVIDQRCVIVGSVHVDGDVWLTGEIDGDLRCRHAHVGATGTVGGVIVAERAVVNGQVCGAIYSNTIELKGGANVEGDIFHEKLILDGGSLFEGRSRRHADPQSMAPEPNEQLPPGDPPVEDPAAVRQIDTQPVSVEDSARDELVRPVAVMNPYHG